LSGYLDTNILVRYLTGDPPALAAKAARIVDDVERLIVTDAVVAETVYVLMNVYGVQRAHVVDHLVGFLRKKNIHTAGADKERVIQGLILCRPSGRVAFTDALVWAAASGSRTPVVYTLDERFPAGGIEVRTSP